MKYLLILPILFMVVTMTHGQYTLYKAEKTDTCAGCRTCVKHESHKTVSYNQYIIEEFQQKEFDTVYIIQYGVVSEVTSMPVNAMAVSFYTNEGPMQKPKLLENVSEVRITLTVIILLNLVSYLVKRPATSP